MKVKPFDLQVRVVTAGGVKKKETPVVEKPKTTPAKEKKVTSVSENTSKPKSFAETGEATHNDPTVKEIFALPCGETNPTLIRSGIIVMQLQKFVLYSTGKTSLDVFGNSSAETLFRGIDMFVGSSLRSKEEKELDECLSVIKKNIESIITIFKAELSVYDVNYISNYITQLKECIVESWNN